MGKLHLGFVRRYAAVMRPEAVYDEVMAQAKDAASTTYDKRRADQALRDDEDEVVELLLGLARHPRCRARDERPESDLEFYTRCAAESLRLA